MLSSARCQCDQHIQTEFIPFAAHQAGYAGLPDTQFFRGFLLRPAALFDRIPQARHQFRSHGKQQEFFGGETQIGEYNAAGIGYRFFVHDLISFSYLPIAADRKFYVFTSGFPRLFPEHMQDVNGIGYFCDINDPPFSLDMQTTIS
jgi:hypothetical protein